MVSQTFISMRRSIFRVLVLVLVVTLHFSYKPVSDFFNFNHHTPVSVIGVQHLGQDYLISRFYINKSIGDSVGEYGGGGSQICCVSLPDKWTEKLSAEVRWEVHKIIRASNHQLPEAAEIVGIYKAQVPIEKYAEPASFWVHFFPDGRARIVITRYGFDGDGHPVRWGDPRESKFAAQGKIIDVFFTEGEVAEFVNQSEMDKKRYGDWR